LNRRRGLGAVAIAVLCFSVSSSVVKKSGADGVAVAFWRLLLTSLVWNVILFVKGRHLTWATIRPLLLPGACFGLNLACFFLAVNNTAIAHAEFIGSSAPLVLVPAGALLYRERLDGRALAWALLAIVGIALVLFAGPAKGPARLGGDLLAVCALLLWTGYLLLGKRARVRLDVAEFMAGVTPIAAVAIIPLIVVDDTDLAMPWGGWLVVCILTVVTGLGAHGLIVFAQRHVPVSTMSVLQVAQPALAVAWAFLLLDEEILAVQLVGMALVLLGLGLFTWSSQRRLRAP
jgi:drug/metabolite transporter (DMT)-like permease